MDEANADCTEFSIIGYKQMVAEIISFIYLGKLELAGLCYSYVSVPKCLLFFCSAIKTKVQLNINTILPKHHIDYSEKYCD